MTKRLLAAALTLALTVGLIPGRAKAEYPAGNRIRRITLEGTRAAVEYSAEEDAELVVAAYTEDGKELLASGRKKISAATGAETELRISGQLPEYALVRGFLLDRKDHSPLGPVCTTSSYTRDPDKLGTAEPEDFAEDRVLAIGTKGDFAALKQGVVLLRQDGTATGNRLTSRDDEELRCEIGEPDERIRDLQAGQCLVLETDPGEFRILRVKKIYEEETKVVLTGDPTLELTDVFDLIRLKTDVGESGFVREEDLWDVQGDAVQFEQDGVSGTAVLKGSAAAEIASTTEERFRLEFSADTSGSAATEGATEVTIPLGCYTASPAAGVCIRFSPVLLLRTEKAETIHWKMKGTFGFSCDGAGNFETLGTKPEIFLTADQPGQVEATIDFAPEMTLWGEVVSLRMKAELGGTATLTALEGHRCLSGTLTPLAASEGFVSRLAMPWNVRGEDLRTEAARDGTFYWMPETQEGNWGSCGETMPQPPAQPPEQTEPATPELPATPGETEQPGKTDVPEIPKTPESTEPPRIPEEPEEPGEEEQPESPESPEPELPEPEPTEPPEEEQQPDTPGYRLEEGVLYIEMTEPMKDYAPDESRPWESQKDKIREVRIGSGISRIGSRAFAGCSGLKSVQIKDPELVIGEDAFAGCDGLEAVYYNGTRAQWRNLAVGSGNEALQGAVIHCSNGGIRPSGTTGR